MGSSSAIPTNRTGGCSPVQRQGLQGYEVVSTLAVWAFSHFSACLAQSSRSMRTSRPSSTTSAPNAIGWGRSAHAFTTYAEVAAYGNCIKYVTQRATCRLGRRTQLQFLAWRAVLTQAQGPHQRLGGGRHAEGNPADNPGLRRTPTTTRLASTTSCWACPALRP